MLGGLGRRPAVRYPLLAPTAAGLVSAAVRVSGLGRGRRVTAKLIRWPKLSVSELSIEASGGHRVVAVQVEGAVLKGVDEEADRIAEFTRNLVAEIDGRKRAAIPSAFVKGAAGAAAVAGQVRRDADGARRARDRAPRSELKPPVTSPRESTPPAAPVAVGAEVALVPPATPGPAPRKPTARRSSAGQRPDEPGAAGTRMDQREAEPEVNQPAWVAPHSIEERPSGKPNRPRPWMP